MSRLFISHSSANNAIALALGQWLESQGWSDYFLDLDADQGIAPGERWDAVIKREVDGCDAALFLISPAWKESKYCFLEFDRARERGKRLFGIVIEPVAPGDLPTQLPAEWQLCDLSHANDPVVFTVERAPQVPRGDVALPRTGLADLARGLREAGLAADTFDWPPASDPHRSPYPGLSAMDRADAAVYFGREAAIADCLHEIRGTCEAREASFFVILGASGAGKSSFLRAGLLPRLARDSDHFIVLPTLRCERAALSGPAGLWAVLRQALEQAGQRMSLAQVRELVAAQGLGRMLQRLRGGPGSSGVSTGAAHSTDARTLIVPIDQFEELFATDGQVEATEFLQLITQALPAVGSAGSPGAGRLLLLVTIRSDALPTLQNHPLLRELKPVLFSLPAMAPSNFKDVIEGPARRHSEKHRLTIDPALTEALLADAQGPDVLPLLALTLDWLLRDFGQRDGTELGLAQYQTIGRVSGVIDRAVQRALAQPDHPPAIPRGQTEQDALLHRLFGFIATVDPDARQPKRRVALRSDLRQALGAEGDALVSRLVEQRLLVADARSGDSDGPATETVEIAHEALLRQWGVMKRWLAEMAERLTAVESLRRSASDWQRSNRDEALLVHTGHRLGAAEVLRQDEQLRHRLDSGDSDYLEACRARDDRLAREREEQLNARARWQRRFAWVLGVACIGVVALLGWIVNQTREVSIQTSIVLSAAAERAADDEQFDRAVRLALLASRESWLYPRQSDVRGTLVRAVGGNRLHVVFRDDSGVQSATFSPDGQHVLTTSKNRTARLWNTLTGEALGVPMAHDAEISSVTFSPDGERVLTHSWNDKTARLWDAQTGQSVGAPMRHKAKLQSAEFSPDGQLVLTISEDRTAQVWDGRTGHPNGPTLQHNAPISYAAFSLEGRSILTLSNELGNDGTVQAWNTKTGRPQFTLIQRSSSFSLSPDGQRILTYSSKDLTARMWEAATGHAIGIPMRHDAKVNSAIFSPDGRHVLTKSGANTMRLWDARTGRQQGQPMRHEAEITSALFSPDGTNVITVSWEEMTVRIWDTSTGQPVGIPLRHKAAVNSAVFSPDGHRVLTVSGGSTTQLWDVVTGLPLGTSMLHEGYINSAVFSPDGQWVLTATMAEKRARLWDARTGQEIGAPMRQDEAVSFSIFSPDGIKVLTTSRKGRSARLWNARTGETIGAPMRHEGDITSASFSPDGRWVLTASADRSSRLWDAQGHRPTGAALPHDAEVASAVFSPNNKIILTASVDRTARLWDPWIGKLLCDPMRHGGAVLSAVFSPDGARVLTASWEDRTARIWDTQTCQLMGTPMQHDSPVRSAIFSPDGHRILTESDDQTVRLWDASTGKALGEPIRREGAVFGRVMFSPDGKWVLTASSRSARIWNAQTGQSHGVPLQHEGLIWSAVFSPDGLRILTAAYRDVSIWDVQSGRRLSAPIQHNGIVVSAVFSPDGQRVLTAAKQTSRLWSVQPSLPSQLDDLITHACKTLQHGARQITERDLAVSRILPHGFQVGDDVCKGLPAAAATVH